MHQPFPHTCCTSVSSHASINRNTKQTDTNDLNTYNPEHLKPSQENFLSSEHNSMQMYNKVFLNNICTYQFECEGNMVSNN